MPLCICHIPCRHASHLHSELYHVSLILMHQPHDLASIPTLNPACCQQEEDFITHTFGLPLQPSQASGLQDRAPKAKPLAGVSLAEDQLLTSRQASHHQAGPSGSLGSQETTALLARLRFSKSFLQVQLEFTSSWVPCTVTSLSDTLFSQSHR